MRLEVKMQMVFFRPSHNTARATQNESAQSQWWAQVNIGISDLKTEEKQLEEKHISKGTHDDFGDGGTRGLWARWKMFWHMPNILNLIFHLTWKSMKNVWNIDVGLADGL